MSERFFKLTTDNSPLTKKLNKVPNDEVSDTTDAQYKHRS